MKLLYFILIFTGDDEEKKSFRSRGIPVIFQDELEEKPDIGNKSPIILKYEKPPLLPHNNKDGESLFVSDFYLTQKLVCLSIRQGLQPYVVIH